jgi:hypothetical protein
VANYGAQWPTTSWTTFPFEGDFQAKPLQPPVPPEPARNDESDLAD